MIRINIEEPDSKIWKLWLTACKKKTAELIDTVDEGGEIDISDLYKRKSIKKSYLQAKDGFFHGKCVYCECYVKDFQHGDVEHYRPKKGVTDENDVPVVLQEADGTSESHPGYYWLAYDWRNLVLSCVDCNQPNTVDGQKVGKHNRFPVVGDHAATPEEVDDEEPLLLHPCVDEPSEHLEVDIASGAMIDKTPQGKMSIDIFGLNVRGRLKEERKKAVDEVTAQFLKIVMEAPGKEDALRVIQEYRIGRRAYSMAGRAKLERLSDPLSVAISR